MTVTLRTVLLALVLGTALAGCNTMEGLGKDMKQAGEAIERKADRD
ncbi:entericidin A [Marinobacter persicus]|uniref:Entericidin A n=1 Tax=Marinobacter persicus TaxID=930118 RepID=A0A1I3VIR3_9GAMM|nr:entericidin A/B family lipoprotein [Marinobacter persicus]GHD51551.1 hypothetical protein GCM10008110_23410 [Marinobacter persicus]SFJ95314.1 entericidin A [Marinobacter persicus]